MASDPQRTVEFNGGIKPGTTAYDDQSRLLDSQLKRARDELAVEINLDGLCMRRRLRGSEIISGAVEGCEPDGGIWMVNDVPIASFEAKKQGRVGNAHERWFKNHRLLTHLNPSVTYVTFCAREGTEPGSTLWRTFSTVLALHGRDPHQDWNRLFLKDVSFFGSATGFSYTLIKSTMYDAITRSYDAFQNSDARGT